MSFFKDHENNMEESRARDRVIIDLLDRADNLVSELKNTVDGLKNHLAELNSEEEGHDGNPGNA